VECDGGGSIAVMDADNDSLPDIIFTDAFLDGSNKRVDRIFVIPGRIGKIPDTSSSFHFESHYMGLSAIGPVFDRTNRALLKFMWVENSVC
jgi:hypothetical protein